MSLMTSGVKIRLCPRMLLSESWSSMVAPVVSRGSEHQLAFAGLEGVVIPELLRADELAESARTVDGVEAEFAVEDLVVVVCELGLDAVDAEGGDLAAYVYDPVVHG